MQPEVYLRFAAVALTCSLQIAAAYLAALLIARCAPVPKLRFAVWSAFAFGAAAYWLTNLALLAVTPHSTSGAIGVAAASSRQLLVPNEWQRISLLAIQVLAAIYAGGGLVSLCALAWRHARLRWALRRASAAGAELNSMAREIRRSRDVRRSELLTLPGISSPATAFFWKPRVLLPENFVDASREAQADVLLHELTHIRRHDYLWATLADLAACVLWFHPAIAWARRKMRVERELACDEAVLAGRPERRAEYAESLAAFARMELLSNAPPIGVDFAASAPLLTLRVNAILRERKRGFLLMRLLRAGIALTAVAGLVAIFPLFAVGFGIGPATTAKSLPARLAIQPLTRHLSHKPHRSQLSEQPIAGQISAVSESPTAMPGRIFPPDPALSESLTVGARVTDSSAETETSSSSDSAPVWTGGPAPAPPRRSVARQVAVAVAGIIIHSDHDRPGEHLVSAGQH